MKLFVWANPYRVPYGNSMVFAVAETIEDARREAAKGASWFGADIGPMPDKDRSGYADLLGEPTRIIDVPCAEWHEWSE